MTVKKAFAGLILVAIFVGVGTLFNQPKGLSVPFAQSMRLQPDYRPPGEGLTLYATGGPFGFDVIEATATGTDGSIFVGTFGGGLFKSEDQGKHWRPVNRGLHDKFISTLFVLENGKVFAGTIRAGLFMSEDQGENWISVNKGLEKTDVTTLTVLTSGALLAGTGKGVYISHNQGQLWEPFNTGLEHTQIKSIAIDKDENLYAGTQGLGIFKREPRGERWFSIVNGFAFKGLEERSVRTLLFNRDEVLFAGTMAAGVFRSADRGSTWQHANVGLENLSIRGLAYDNDGVLYVGTGIGVYYSKNQGETWQALNNGMSDVQIHSFSASPSGAVYIGVSDGLYFGKINTAWQPLHESLMISPILSLSYGENQITVGTDGKGTYINYQDKHWMSDNLGLVNLTIRALVRDNAFLYAMTEAGIYRRQLGRHQWSRLNKAPASAGQAMTVDVNKRLYLGMPDGLYHSSDHGDTWSKISEIGADPVTAFAVAGETVFAATAHQIWSKTPEGPWEKILTKEEGIFHQMLWQPEKGLLALSNQALWQRDLAGTWKSFDTEGLKGARILSLAVDPHNSDLLYIGTDQGLYWSADNAITWQRAQDSRGETFEGRVNQVLTTDTSALWLATEADGVFLGISKPAERTLIEKWTDALVATE